MVTLIVVISGNGGSSTTTEGPDESGANTESPRRSASQVTSGPGWRENARWFSCEAERRSAIEAGWGG